jgi:dihydrofolate reductase
MKKVILYLAMSVDGFIARKGGEVDWLDKFNDGTEGYGYKEFYSSIDSVILGRTTFDQFPNSYPDKDCYLLSHKESGYDNVKAVSGEPSEILKGIKKEGNVWLVGGASVVNQFLKAGLIDEFIITVIPTTLGSGIRLFDGENEELGLKLEDSKFYDSGVVQLRYKPSK